MNQRYAFDSIFKSIFNAIRPSLNSVIMKQFAFLTLICLLWTSQPNASGFNLPNRYITVGPTWNVYFGEGTSHHTFGFQSYYWDLKRFPIGAGGGLEFDFQGKPYYFAELQTGIIWTGVSAGVVYHPDLGLGFQGATWLNLILGGKFRYRSLGEGFYGGGSYLTLPLPVVDR